MNALPKQARSPAGLTLPATTAAGRSSVVDRVKWIEKTHGVNDIVPQAPRARLRLPKHFVEKQGGAAATGSGGQAEKQLVAVAVPVKAKEAKAEAEVESEAEAEEYHDMEHDEEHAADHGVEKVPEASESEYESSDHAAAAPVEAEAPAGPKSQAEYHPHSPPPTDHTPDPHLHALPSPVPSEISTIAPLSPAPSFFPAEFPLSHDPPNAQFPSEEQEEQGGRGIKLGLLRSPHRSRANSEESIVSLQDDDDGLLYMSRRSSVSDMEGFDTGPVHVQISGVGGSRGSGGPGGPGGPGSPGGSAAAAAAAAADKGSNVRLFPRSAKPAAAAKAPAPVQAPTQAPAQAAQAAQPAKYARSTDRPSNKDSDTETAKLKSLGGIRGRSQPTARRYNRTQPMSSSGSTHSVQDTCERPQGPGLVQIQGSQGHRAVSSSSHTEDGSEDDGSLLRRLNKMSTVRPNVQDLVSNKPAPKFVKRSPHFNTTLLANDTAGPAGTSASGSTKRGAKTQKRYI
ncbi:hypothetical protein LPJ66_001693 [Kickxella alabastrina]|uniref:Uncharacterized protein n=1 Tax=Kickxella alabastrina TaxID=61397 RepID=A0ACC1ISJ6_9FUNG|nr:hypothetical protein LPJ66_001693 [Kickxella alabastrina]